MNRQSLQTKTRQWLRRYIPAEIFGTILSVVAAWITFGQTHSYVAAAGAGWIGEGIGFFGYFIVLEFLESHRQFGNDSYWKRIVLAVRVASTNLLVEFLPAEIIDNVLIRPYLMFIVPQHIKPYAIGFLVAKFGADIIFYMFAVIGYESRKRWLRR